MSSVVNLQFQHRRFTTEGEKERSEAQETDEHTQADEASHQQDDIPDGAEVDLAAVRKLFYFITLFRRLPT